MKEIGLHLLDIIENSAKGGAARVRIDLKRAGSFLEVRIADDGPGMPPDVAADPTDPFATTRRERKVGLGLAMLRMAAERTGGRVQVESVRGRGVTVNAVFDLAHIDAQPVGALHESLALACASWPKLDFEIRVGSEKKVVLDTAALKKEIAGLDFSSPKVQNFMVASLKEDIEPLCGI